MKGRQVDTTQGCHSLRNNGQWPLLDNRKSNCNFLISIFSTFFIIDNHFYKGKTTSIVRKKDHTSLAVP